MKYDMRHIGDFMFKNKSEYINLSDEDKETFFFIMNRKFARNYPKQAQFFNKKGMDKASSLDVWYDYFISKDVNGIPGWYWFKLSAKKEKRILKKEEEEFLTEFYQIRKEDLDFLIKYYPDEVKAEVKKYKKFNK